MTTAFAALVATRHQAAPHLHGRFLRATQAENADADTLEAAAQAKTAFDFVRVEDLAQGRGKENRNSEHRGPEVEGGYGRILVYDINSNKITRASAATGGS